MSLRFTLRQLQYFIAAAERESISDASRHVHIAQTAISSAIAKLEDQLGVDLIVTRHAHGISLTQTGEKLLTEARKLVREAENFQRKAFSFSNSLGGDLRIGSYSSLTSCYLPSMLRGFAERYPAIRVRTVDSKVEELVEQLRSGEIEIALVYDLDLPSDLAFSHLTEAPPYAVLPEGHPLAAQRAVSLQEIGAYPLILLDTPLARRYYTQLFEEAGVEVNAAFSAPSIEALRGMVGWGLGVSVLVSPPTNFTFDGRPIVHRPISNRVLSKMVGLASLRDLRLTKNAQQFVFFAREHFGKEAEVRLAAVPA